MGASSMRVREPFVYVKNRVLGDFSGSPSGTGFHSGEEHSAEELHDQGAKECLIL
jgi:hypothetical protein